MAKSRRRGRNTNFTTRAKRQLKAHPMASAAIAATATAAAAAGAYLWSQRAAA